MKNYILLCMLFLTALSLIGQDDSSLGKVTVLMQNQAKLTGSLESEQANKIELKIDGEAYVIKKNDIIAIIPSEMLAASLENGVLKKDLILLKSKIWISGEVLELDSKIVYLKTDGGTHILKSKDVNKIYLKGQNISLLARTNNEDYFTEPLIVSKLKRQYVKEGFYHILYGDINYDTGLGVQYNFGYQFTRKMGLGLGLAYFKSYSSNFFVGPGLLPVFVEARGYMSDRKTSGYYNLAVGVTMGTQFLDNVNAEITPGLYTHPAIGYKIGSDRVAFLIDVGVQIASARYDFEFSAFNRQGNFTEVFETKSLVIRLGIMF